MPVIPPSTPPEKEYDIPITDDKRGKKRKSSTDEKVKRTKSEAAQPSPSTAARISGGVTKATRKQTAGSAKITKAIKRTEQDAGLAVPAPKRAVHRVGINDLPREAMAHTLSFLPIKDVARAGKVSLGFRGHSQKELVHRLNKEKIPLDALGITTEAELVMFLQSLGEYKQNLNCLDISHIKLTTAISLPNSLTELRARGSNLTDEILASMLTNCSRLQKLQISDNPTISGAGFDQLPPSVQEFGCSNCSLTDGAVAKLSSRCSSLVKLNISNGNITGVGFDQLPSSVQQLDCAGCALMNDAVAKLSLRCSSLVKMNISYNRKITGVGFDQLPSSVQEFICIECSLTDDALAKLRSRKFLVLVI